MAKKYKILIIDDSKETVAGLKSFLQKKYSILAAYDGFEGIQALENAQGEIDLVITDLVMPSISGTTLIGIIKKEIPGNTHYRDDGLWASSQRDCF
jgi:two-component system cell cycle sensor histidine kinase/response regulator CckA